MERINLYIQLFRMALIGRMSVMVCWVRGSGVGPDHPNRLMIGCGSPEKPGTLLPGTLSMMDWHPTVNPMEVETGSLM